MTDSGRRAKEPQNKGTRGRVLSLLREGQWTVDDLADRLGLTDNAVRSTVVGSAVEVSAVSGGTA